MKLAEALSHRTALADKIRETESRLVENVKVQEGDSPVENPTAVILDLESTLADLQALIYRINLTNTRTIGTIPPYFSHCKYGVLDCQFMAVSSENTLFI